MRFNHQELAEIGRKWLLRPSSARGAGCKIAFTELKSGHSGEIPDVIGWRSTGMRLDGSVVIEVKVSRADFLADKKKPHRSDVGLGNWRMYLCPEGMIAADELPKGWGLIYVNSRRHVKNIVSPFGIDNYVDRDTALSQSWQDTDLQAERFMLVGVVNRIGDSQKLTETLRRSQRITASLSRELERKRTEYQALQAKWYKNDVLLGMLMEQHPHIHEQLCQQYDHPADAKAG